MATTFNVDITSTWTEIAPAATGQVTLELRSGEQEIMWAYATTAPTDSSFRGHRLYRDSYLTFDGSVDSVYARTQNEGEVAKAVVSYV